VGFSGSGLVVGPSSAVTKVVTCDSATASAAEYHVTGSTMSGFVRHSTTGTSEMHVSVSSSETTMTWVREAFNGDAKDAQITSNKLDNLVYLIGTVASFDESQPGSVGTYESGVVSALELPASVVCSSVALDGKMSMSWSVRGLLISYSVVLKGMHAWYVTFCECSCLR
jgi:hypothetical protein